MDPKRRRAIWIGGGILFALAVGSGYLPDLMLARQIAAARAEGIVQPLKEEPAIPPAQNARIGYEQALRRNQTGIGLLRGRPNEITKPSVFARKLLNEIAEASKRKVYALPKTDDIEDPKIRYAIPTVYRDEPDLVLVARSLAATAPNEERLLAAARVGRHLRDGTPVGFPTTSWTTIANAALNGADRLNLPPDARARVVAALGEPPNPISVVRSHVGAVLAMVESSNRTAGDIRGEVRFLSYWRGFLKTAPREPEAFAKMIKSSEIEMIRADEQVGIWRLLPFAMTSNSSAEWAKWADASAKTIARLEREPKGR